MNNNSVLLNSDIQSENVMWFVLKKEDWTHWWMKKLMIKDEMICTWTSVIYVCER